jgi:hypothetical protein
MLTNGLGEYGLFSGCEVFRVPVFSRPERRREQILRPFFDFSARWSNPSSLFLGCDIDCFLREVQRRESAMILDRRGIANASGFNRAIEIAKMNSSAIYFNLRAKLSFVPFPVNAEKSRLVICAPAAVTTILLTRTYTEVGPLIVEGVSVDVIHLEAWERTGDNSSHRNTFWLTV